MRNNPAVTIFGYNEQMKTFIYRLFVVLALAACSAGPQKPSISPNTDGLKQISPKQSFEDRFCISGTKKDLGGMVKMADEKQYAIGRCRYDLFDKRNTLIIYFADQADATDYADAELDAYLHPDDFLTMSETDEEDCVEGSKCDANKKFLERGAIVYFDEDSDVPVNVADLQRMAQSVRDRAINISVIGHTDSSFTEEHNKALSLRRAKKAKEILVSFGVPENSISIEGRSSHEPIDTNETEQGMAKNRRAEIKRIGNEH